MNQIPNYFAKPYRQIAQPAASQQNSQGTMGNMADSFQAGALSAVGGIFDFVGAKGLASQFYGWSDDQVNQMSDAGRESMGKQIFTEDEEGNFKLGEGATDLDTWLLGFANVAGQFLPTAIPGAGAAGLVTKAAKLGSIGSKVATGVGMGATGGSAATGQGMEQARDEIRNMPNKLKAESPIFQELIRGIHAQNPDATPQEKWKLATDALADQVANEVRSDPKVLLANFGASAIGDPIIGRALVGARIAKSGAIRSAFKGFVAEGTTEAAQAGVQQYGINEAIQPIDNRDTMQGVASAAANEGILGGVFGGVAGGAGGVVNRQTEKPVQTNEQAQPTQPEQQAQPVQPKQPDPATEAVKASNPVLGDVLEQFDNSSSARADALNQAVNYDIPTAARQAGAQTPADVTRFGEMLDSPIQAALNRMRENRSQTVQDMINKATQNKTPTPQDRFLPQAFEYEGQLLRNERLPKVDQQQSPIIEGETVQPLRAPNKQITQKDIIFSGNNSGVYVKASGNVFLSPKEALISKNARAAKRAGNEIEAVPFGDGFGWRITKAVTNEQSNTLDTGSIEGSGANQIGSAGITQPDNKQSEVQPVTPRNDIPATSAGNGQSGAKTLPVADGRNADDKALAKTPLKDIAKDLSGEKINKEWVAFADDTGTKKVPRAEMPQIKAEHRGAMVNFMKGRDITHTQEEVEASSLKPTQTEFSPAKVKKAMNYEGGDRSILVSSDNYVLDGHHQWLAKRQGNKPVKVIRLNAPIDELIPLAKEFPSSELANDGVSPVSDTVPVAKEVKPELAKQESTTGEPAILSQTKSKWLNQELAKAKINKNSPGFEAAKAKIEQRYDDELDKAYASLTFERYNELNSDTPESINRSAYEALTGKKAEQSKPKEKLSPKSVNKAVNETATPIEKINDFGEKIGGARKDVWGGFKESLNQDVDVKAEPLSKSFPQPDYEALSQDGASNQVLALIALMRSEIGPKPRLSSKVDRWSRQVNLLRNHAKSLIDGNSTPEKVRKHLRLIDGNLAKIDDTVEVIAEFEPENFKKLADKYRIASGNFSLFGGVKYDKPKNIYFIEVNGRTDYNNNSESLKEVQNKLRNLIKNEKAETDGKKSNISVYSDRYTKAVFLGWKGASGVLRIQEFDNSKQARDYLENNREEVENKLAELKKTPSMRRPENRSRVGKQRFEGQVTPEIFAKTFGFRGVEFGNWVEQTKRQKDLNQAYDGLADLAEALDIPLKAISLDGKLGLAFGARGVGNSGAAAHYEEGSTVINLTKKMGAGSLAHEWFHALDNYFAKNSSEQRGFMTELRPYQRIGGVREEMRKAFVDVMSAIGQTELKSRSNALDKRKSKAYWGTNLEMAARSFERYIIDKLESNGQQNDYLANIVSENLWGDEDGTYPYPTDREAAAINEAFDNFFDTIQTKEGENGNVILFNKSDKPFTGNPVSLGQAKTVTKDFIDYYAGLDDGMVVTVTDKKPSEVLKGVDLNEGDNSAIKGAYDKDANQLYIFAQNHSSIEDVRRTLREELLVHKGLSTFKPEDAEKLINTINGTRNSLNPKIKAIWADIARNYSKASELVQAEEFLGKVAQIKPSSLGKYWNQIVSALTRLMRKAGLVRKGITFTEMQAVVAEIGDKLRQVKRTNDTKEAANSGLSFELDKGMRFNRSTPDTRTAEEKIGQGAAVASDTIAQKGKKVVNALKSSEFWNRAAEGMFDGLHGIKQAEQAKGITDPTKMGYTSARLATGLGDMLHAVFHRGALEWKDGVTAIKKDTKGLLEVIGMLPEGDGLNNWLAWMAAGRAEMLAKQGRENNLTKEDIATLKAKAKGNEALFEEVRKEYNKINSATLDLAQEAGLLSPEQRAAFDEEWYVPFFREQSIDNPELTDVIKQITAPHTTKTGIVGQSAQIKELIGGKGSTKDLLENIIQRQVSMIDAAVKNNAAREISDNLAGTEYMTRDDDDGISEAIDKLGISRGDLAKNFQKVRIMENGKPVYYYVSDPALLRGLLQVHDVGSKALFNKMARSAKRFLTTGITLSPDFIIRNFIRDAAHSWMVNKDGAKLGTDTWKGLKASWEGDNSYWDLIASGAAFQGGYIHGADPEAAQQQIRRALKMKGLDQKEIDGYMKTVVSTKEGLLRAFEKYRNASDKIENANRVATYEAALKAGKSKKQALYESKDLMDYSMKGNFNGLGTFIDMLPFFNARLQGMYKLGRAAAADGDDRFIKVLSKDLAFKGMKVAAFSAALAAINGDDERYKELPEWDKDAHWHFFLGEGNDGHIRIPKPFELGIIFGTLPERLFNFGTGKQTGRDLSDSAIHAMVSTLSLNPIPQLAMPTLEVIMNRSFFTGSPIEGLADQNREKADRYNMNTSDTARMIGQFADAIGLSPKQVQHLITGYTGTLGGYVLGMSDFLARVMTGRVKADTPVSDWPIIKTLYQGGKEPRSTLYQERFYESLQKAQEAYGSYKAAIDENDPERARELFEDRAKELNARLALNRMQRKASEISKRMRAVDNNQSLSSKQKRQQLEELTRIRNDLYEQAYTKLNLSNW